MEERQFGNNYSITIGVNSGLDSPWNHQETWPYLFHFPKRFLTKNLIQNIFSWTSQPIWIILNTFPHQLSHDYFSMSIQAILQNIPKGTRRIRLLGIKVFRCEGIKRVLAPPLWSHWFGKECVMNFGCEVMIGLWCALSFHFFIPGRYWRESGSNLGGIVLKQTLIMLGQSEGSSGYALGTRILHEVNCFKKQWFWYDMDERHWHRFDRNVVFSWSSSLSTFSLFRSILTISIYVNSQTVVNYFMQTNFVNENKMIELTEHRFRRFLTILSISGELSNFCELSAQHPTVDKTIW